MATKKKAAKKKVGKSSSKPKGGKGKKKSKAGKKSKTGTPITVSGDG